MPAWMREVGSGRGRGIRQRWCYQPEPSSPGPVQDSAPPSGHKDCTKSAGSRVSMQQREWKGSILLAASWQAALPSFFLLVGGPLLPRLPQWGHMTQLASNVSESHRISPHPFSTAIQPLKVSSVAPLHPPHAHLSPPSHLSARQPTPAAVRV